MKKILLIVQGEGRGHLTQAIAFAEMVKKAGHEVVATMLGVAEEKPIPDFFRNRINSPIISFQSPSLLYHPKTKALCIGRTIANGILKLPKYLKSIHQIKKTITSFNPDFIINFYDILGGFHQLLSKNLWFNSKPMICIAHQYLLLHKDFIYPKNHHWIDRILVNLNTQLTSLGATKRLALSFRRMDDDTNRNITVVPPLLRAEIWNLCNQITTKNYILSYMTQSSMLRDLYNWHREMNHVEVHCFSDRQQIPAVLKHSRNLYLHKIDGVKFLKMMTECKAVVTSAGFESVCEAMLLGKPVLMIPVPNHFEQACNAVDAEIAGAGIIGDKFNLDALIEYLPKHQSNHTEIKHWFGQSERKIISEIADNQAIIYKKEFERYEQFEDNLLPI